MKKKIGSGPIQAEGSVTREDDIEKGEFLPLVGIIGWRNSGKSEKCKACGSFEYVFTGPDGERLFQHHLKFWAPFDVGMGGWGWSKTRKKYEVVSCDGVPAKP